MPARRRKQSNAMLYTLITFVGLFLVAIIIAGICYVKIEEYRDKAVKAESNLEEMVTSEQWQDRGKIVGKIPQVSLRPRKAGETYLGKMVEHFDGTTSLIVGFVPEMTSAEADVNDANIKVANALKSAREHITIADPNTGLVKIINNLVAELNNTKEANSTLQKDLNNQIAQFGITKKAYSDKEQVIEEEKNKLQALVNKMQADYADLQARLELSTTEQIANVRKQLDDAKAELKTSEDTLRKTQSQLKQTE